MTAHTPPPAGHVADLLPAYLNHTLDHEAMDRIEQHLGGCGACQAELESWRLMARLAQSVTASAVAPSPDLLDRAWTAIESRGHEQPRPSLHASAAHARQVLLGQLPLIQRYTWPASALVMVIGFVIATVGQVGTPSLVIQLLAPIVAALGVSIIYGPENDPSLEVALATPTSPRLILLARLTLVFGYDLLLTLAATAGLVPLGRAGPGAALSAEWLGPMLFLSALALVLSLRVGPTVAMSVALTLWMIRVFVALGGGQGWLGAQQTDLIVRAWATNGVNLVGAAILVVLAFRSLAKVEQSA